MGQFPLAGEGKGVSCVVPAGRRDRRGRGDGWVAESRAAGRDKGGERLERGELSHSAVATFLPGLVGASRHGAAAEARDSRRLCQCRLPENVPSAFRGTAD